MKKLLLPVICLLLFAGSALGQNFEVNKYFTKYENDERFTVVYVSPKMFEMVAKVASDKYGDELTDLVSELKGLWVLTTEETPATFYKEAMASIDTKDYEMLMSVRDEDENVRFWTKGTDDLIKELLLIVGGEDEFVMVSFLGNLDLNKIAKIASKMDIEGLEHLEKLKEEHGHDHDEDDH
jgi:hypothetical protein